MCAAAFIIVMIIIITIISVNIVATCNMAQIHNKAQCPCVSKQQRPMSIKTLTIFDYALYSSVRFYPWRSYNIAPGHLAEMGHYRNMRARHDRGFRNDRCLIIQYIIFKMEDVCRRICNIFFSECSALAFCMVHRID